jgi:hypothetical protein
MTRRVIHGRTLSKRDRRNETSRIAQYAKKLGVKLQGSPREYALIIGDRVMDDHRVIVVSRQVPETLKEGDVVRYVPPGEDKQLSATVIADYQDTVRIKVGSVECLATRANLRAQPTAEKPRIVRKRDLHKHIDSSVAALFWDRKLGLRVPTPRRPPAVVSSPPVEANAERPSLRERGANGDDQRS